MSGPVDRRVPVRAEGAAWQRVDGEVVLLQLDAGELVGLNGVGGRAWELMDGARTVDEIVAAIADAYGVDPARVRADVAAFLDELVAARLILLGD